MGRVGARTADLASLLMTHFAVTERRLGGCGGRNLFENKEEQVSKAQCLLGSEEKPVLISGKFEDDDAHFACR